MNDEDILLQKRILELANKSYNGNIYTFTNFLSLSELNVFYAVEREISYVPYTLFGGTCDCERVVIRFGSEDTCGYLEDFSIDCVEISPLLEKFGEELSHRDYLGALMNLGIERATLGDIIIIKKKAYVFCLEKMSAYIVENLDKIRHTNVRCRVCSSEDIPASTITNLERMNLVISSERLDAVVAKAYNLSRSQALELFRAKKIFVNGRICENNSALPKSGERISVRGFGKFTYIGKSYETKKGKLAVEIDKYI